MRNNFRSKTLSRFITGILYFYEFRKDHKNLFDADGSLTFDFKDAKKYVEKISWKRISKSREKYEINLEEEISNFYIAAAGDLSNHPLSPLPEFSENRFEIEFMKEKQE